MGLTKRHFQAIADMIKKNSSYTEEFHSGKTFEVINKEDLIDDLSYYFKTMNLNFKKDLFEEACYVNDG